MKNLSSVLYVMSFPFPGDTGTPLHAMGIAKAMKEKGLRVHIAKLNPWPLFRNEEDIWEGIPLHRLARPGWGRNLRHLLKKLRPDIVHAHHIGGAVFSVGPCLREQIPLVYECHSFWREEMDAAGDRLSPVQRYIAWKERDVFRKCSHIIALSEKMKATHVIERAVPASKITVIYPGVKSDWIDRNEAASVDIQGVRSEDFVVMYCGNFAQYQGVDLLLGGISKAIKSESRLKAVLIGARPDEMAAKQKQWGDLEGHVIYLGRLSHEEMPPVFARADCLTIPRPDSRICWTMPRKFGEYLSAGKPLLVTDVGDHRRVVERFHCGIVTDCSAEGIAKGLLKLIELPDDTRRRIGRNALIAAREWFDWDRQMDQVCALYRQLM